MLEFRGAKKIIRILRMMLNFRKDNLKVNKLLKASQKLKWEESKSGKQKGGGSAPVP